MTTCPICLDPAHTWDCSHASLMARVRALSDERDAARKLATAKAADVDRLTAILGAETERALVLEGERDDYRSQADAERARWRPIAERASRAEQERDTLRAQIANATRGHDTTIATLTVDAPVTLHTRDGAIRVRKLVHANADPRIGDLTEKIRAGDGTADDLRVLCDVAERVALLEALVAEKDEALADRQRLLDLVRHQRGPLHDENLITDEEYALLAGDHGAVARLEGYDEARVKLATLCADIDRKARGDQEGRVTDAPRTDPMGALASVTALRQPRSFTDEGRSMKPADALAIKATRARFAFLNAKRITREQRCSEASASGPEDGPGRDFCWRDRSSDEPEDWCDGCRARSAALPEIDRLRKEWQRAWSAARRALAREAAP